MQGNELACALAQPDVDAHPLRVCVLSWIVLSAAGWAVLGSAAYALWSVLG
jgi:hypothetical protein